MKYDVIIIGGGVLGVSLAFHLTSYRGDFRDSAALKVLVLEREIGVAHHASGKNAGMIRHLYRHPTLTDWAKRSVEGWPRELREKVFKETGSLVLGREIPMHHQELFEAGTLNINSHVTTTDTPYVYTRKDGLIDSGAYVEGLRQLAKQQGANISVKSKVEQVLKEENGWLVRLSSGETLKAKWIVNATGAWLNYFANQDSPVPEIAANAYARYLFHCDSNFRDRPLEFKGYSGKYGFFWDEVHEWYFRKWSGNELLLSICEIIPADPDNYSPSEASLGSLSNRLSLIMPDFASSLKLIRSWHCFRTYTGDLLPIWGEDREAPGLFWLAAFGGFGMSTSFAAAEDAARYMRGKDVAIYDDFSPERVKVQGTQGMRLSVNV